MTDRPILFSAEMVRAILDGRKTQTRRVMKVQPWPDATVEVGPYHPHWIDRNGESQPGPSTFGAVWDHQDIVNGGDAGLRCPYGAPGDTLWVRETWTQYPIELNPEPCDAWYKATSNGHPPPFKWRPSIHMPRWASRITLRITDIRVERLQDISEEDAQAEGATMRPACNGFQHRYPGWSMDWSEVGQLSPYATGAKRGVKAPLTEGDVSLHSPKSAFARLWNNINDPGAWEANPWVWVISFERVEP